MSITDFKPAKGTAKAALHERKAKRRAADEKDERSAKLAAAHAWQVRRAECFARDRGRCRAFGMALQLTTDVLSKRAEIHHKVYRSCGGTDHIVNLITLCPTAHRLEHEHRLRISGDPDGVLTFTEVDLESGRVIREWTSACPT